MKLFDGSDIKFKRMLDDVNEGRLDAPLNPYKYRILEKSRDTKLRFALADNDLNSKICREIGDDAYLLNTRWTPSQNELSLYDFEIVIFNNVINILPRGLDSKKPFYWIGLIDEDHKTIDICHYKRKDGRLTVLQKWEVNF